MFLKSTMRASRMVLQQKRCQNLLQKNFSTLILAEHLDGQLGSSVGSCLTAAGELNDPHVDVLVHGSEDSVKKQVDELKKYPGLTKIYTATHNDLENAYGNTIAKIASNLVKENSYTNVISASSGFGKDVVPRIGGLLDLQPITDVVKIQDGGARFVRPVYAGNAMCTVSTSDDIKLFTVRGTNFDKVPQGDASEYDTQAVSGVDEIMAATNGHWVENMVSKSEMADLPSAKYVVSGGRALKSGENFQMLYDIADTLGKSNCAIGASRAAVDAGMVPNDMQVGQTGKVVAPDLYIAIGISGAIQHVSGMKDSKVIVAINKDGDAPIFKIANYGLVGDLFKILPELNEKLKAAM